MEEFAEADKTLCDYDGAMPRNIAQRVFALAGMIGAKPLWIRQDRTRRGWHLIVKWDQEFTPAELTAIQAILGSDPNREALNLSRVRAGIETAGQQRCWNILYRRKVYD